MQDEIHRPCVVQVQETTAGQLKCIDRPVGCSIPAYRLVVIHQNQLTYYLIHNCVHTVQSSDIDVSVPWMVLALLLKYSSFITELCVL